ncbi:site-specific integrase [Bacillaceae bacterium IKA-2]|nr:site-specific integrase [Bacillaceae bacterium IKA-2]
MESLMGITLPEFVNEYLDSLVKKNRKPATIKRYRYDLEDFFLWLRTEKNDQSFSIWSNLKTTDIEKYIFLLTDTRNYHPRTTKRIITVLNQLYKYYDNLGLSQNPISKIAKIEMDEPTMIATDFLTSTEINKLFLSIASSDGLSENQLKTRHFIVNRNEAIIILFLYYGLTLQEVTNIVMTDVHFETSTLNVSGSEKSRSIKLSIEHKQLLYKYYQVIPEPVRPSYHQNDPFFVAFDFQRGTYRWIYDTNKPKSLTNIAVQRMIQKEIRRGKLRKQISPQHFRNTFILSKIKEGRSMLRLKELSGLKTELSLKKYFQYATLTIKDLELE